jgi:multidrug efflux system outer membrane protein
MCYRLFLYSGLLLASSSCSIGPDYQAPELELPKTFSAFSEELEAEMQVQQEVLWWKGFQDEKLNALIQRSVDSNLGVQQALTRINQSRALAREAFSELLPGALLGAGYTKAEETGNRFPGGSSGDFEFEVYTASIDALWEIDIFGRLRRELEARNAEFDVKVADLHDAVRMLISEVATAYFELRAAQVQLGISNKNQALQERSLEIVSSKYDLGQVSELDVARSQTQLAQTKADIPLVTSRVDMQINRLSVLLGKHPRFLKVELGEPGSLPVYQGALSIGTPDELLQRRPDLRAAERRVAASNARIGAALGELFPKITISGSLGWEADKPSNWGATATRYSFGPSISWAAFDTGRLRARVDEADERTQESLFSYEEAVLRALEDVENALVSFSAEQQRLQELRTAVTASNRAYTIANDQYNEGVLDFISVLDAQRTLLQTESDAVTSEKNLSLALVGIYKSLGGGWEAWDLKVISESEPTEVAE